MKFKFGRRFNIPRTPKGNKNADTSEPPKNIEMFPKCQDGETHPLPFYITEETLAPFKDPPWKEALEREERERFKEFCRNPNISRYFRDAFLKEVLEEEVLAVASLSIIEVKTKKEFDQETEIYMEEEIFLPAVQREVFICVWELLYDWGRELSPEQFKEMQKKEDKLKMTYHAEEILSAQMLECLKESNWREDLTDEKKLSGERWEVLLYNYASKLQRNSFARNVALHMLQEWIVSQAATDEVSHGLMSYLEHDMVQLDEKEKVHVPPRTG